MDNAITGEVVEMGDDDGGQTRIIIHTTPRAIMQCGVNLMFKRVTVQLAPEQEES